MTKEKALKILNECRDKGFERTTYTVEEYHTARDMAIRALEEQETVTEFADRCRECGREKVLKKICRKIMKLQTYKMFEGEDTLYVELEDVLQIIDKYKAEREEL